MYFLDKGSIYTLDQKSISALPIGSNYDFVACQSKIEEADVVYVIFYISIYLKIEN
jgi:hypothetical protein